MMKKTVEIKVEDMDCSSCVLNIDGVLEDTDGVDEARTNFAKERTLVTFDPQKISIQKIIALINSTGYSASKVN